MMNSTANDDDFGDNPFRTVGAGDDVFFDAPTAVPTSPPSTATNAQPTSFQPQFSQQQPPPPQQQQQMQQQQSFQPQPEMFAQPPQQQFPSPSGPMDNMAGQQQQQQQQTMTPINSNASGPTSWWGNCMMFCTLDSYRAYFDIDAEDIVTRMKSVFLDFYKPEHFRNNVLGITKTGDGLKGPDLYGPFWITMTLIFFLGVTSNMHDYLHRSDVEQFDYDINHLMHAASVLCTFSFFIPIILWITTQCMNMQALMLVEWVCLYGYSLTPFLLTTLLCVIPYGLVSTVLLALSTLISCSLIVRNVAAPLLSSDVGQAKAPPLILAILGSHAIFFLFVKFSFYHHKKHKSG